MSLLTMRYIKTWRIHGHGLTPMILKWRFNLSLSGQRISTFKGIAHQEFVRNCKHGNLPRNLCAFDSIRQSLSVDIYKRFNWILSIVFSGSRLRWVFPVVQNKNHIHSLFVFQTREEIRKSKVPGNLTKMEEIRSRYIARKENYFWRGQH